MRPPAAPRSPDAAPLPGTARVLLVGVLDVLFSAAHARATAQAAVEAALGAACPTVAPATLATWFAEALARTERAASDTWSPTALADRIAASAVPAYGRATDACGAPMDPTRVTALSTVARDAWVQGFQPVSGARQALETLREAGWTLVGWGVGPVPVQKRALQTCALAPLFHAIHLSPMTHRLHCVRAARLLSEMPERRPPRAAAAVLAGPASVVEGALDAGLQVFWTRPHPEEAPAPLVARLTAAGGGLVPDLAAAAAALRDR